MSLTSTVVKMAAPTKELRVVEFYSGVGGMHYALTLSKIPSTVVAAVDINEVANKVYKYNFPDVNLLQRNIQSVSLKDFSQWNADVFLMSPPCQPFTRVGLKGDKTDPRTSSFLYLLETIPKLTKRPDYILIENVKGFETSNTRDELIEVLQKCHYKFKEFLLSPTDVGVPNQRLRYFLLAKLSPLVFKESSLSDKEQCLLKHEITSNTTCCHSYQEKVDKNSEGSIPLSVDRHDTEIAVRSEDCPPNNMVSNESQLPPELNIKHSARSSTTENSLIYPSNSINDYLESLSQERFQDYSVPDKLLLRFGRVMDIVRNEDARTCCFTKAYGHYVEGTGSFLQTNNSVTKQWAFQDNPDSTQTLSRLKNLGLRYFTPREVANFHHFPKEFNFPPEISRKQQYRVLGNSLNAFVVSLLLRYLVQ